MTDHLNEDDVLTAIPGLTRARLVGFVRTEMIIPLRRGRHGIPVLVFRQFDFARTQLLCDLTDDLDPDKAALGVVVSLIDHLHARRLDLVALARAIADEPADAPARIGASVLAAGG